MSQPIFQFLQKGSRDQSQSSQLACTSCFTHLPKDRDCEVCELKKYYPSLVQEPPGSERKPCASPTKKGDAKTADHKVYRTNLACGIVMQSWWRIFVLVGLKVILRRTTAQETMNSLQKFAPQDQKPGTVRAVNSLEFSRVCEDLCWNH